MCVLLVLATYLGRDGIAFPSLRTLAAASRMSVNTLRRHLAHLDAAGWVEISARTGSRAANGHRVYRPTVPDHIQLTDVDERLRDHRLAEQGEAESVSPSVDTHGAGSAPSVATHLDTHDAADVGNATTIVRSTSDCINPLEESVSTLAPTVSTDPKCVSAMLDTEVLEAPREALKTEEGRTLPHDDRSAREPQTLHRMLGMPAINRRLREGDEAREAMTAILGTGAAWNPEQLARAASVDLAVATAFLHARAQR